MYLPKIINLNGTSEHDCSCGSWLQHWKKFSNRAATKCAVFGCPNLNLVGGHVQFQDSDRWFIVPLCSGHNNLRGSEFYVHQDTYGVYANKAETCKFQTPKPKVTFPFPSLKPPPLMNNPYLGLDHPFTPPAPPKAAPSAFRMFSPPTKRLF